MYNQANRYIGEVVSSNLKSQDPNITLYKSHKRFIAKINDIPVVIARSSISQQWASALNKKTFSIQPTCQLKAFEINRGII